MPFGDPSQPRLGEDELKHAPRAKGAEVGEGRATVRAHRLRPEGEGEREGEGEGEARVSVHVRICSDLKKSPPKVKVQVKVQVNGMAPA